MIIGIGIDVIQNERIAQSLERFGDRMLERLFQPGELAYAARKRTGAQSLAVRLAAKQAGRRALSLAGVVPPPLRSLEVVRPPGREPTLRVLGLADPVPEMAFSVSLTHDADLAVATVWLERRAPEATGSR